MHKHLFAAAVAAAALIAMAGSPSAQDTKKEQQASKKGALQGADGKMLREIAQSDLAEVAAGKLGASKAHSAEVKADAEKTAPVIQNHLEMAKQIASALK